LKKPIIFREFQFQQQPTNDMTTLIYRILIIVTALGLSAACAPLPTTPTSNNLAVEMRRLQSSMHSQQQTVQDLSRQVAELKNQLQQQAQEIARFSKPQRQMQTGYQPTRTPQGPGVGTIPTQGESSPTEVYLQAFGDYASGRYQTATHGFETFLQRFPNNSYASNAQFWLSDCYFNQQQYALAIPEFERVLNDYPSAPKSPDALLKIAIAQLQLGATDEARQAVDTLSRRYPKSTATQKAQELAIP
jgi:tol-pal system protein YbgF